MAKAAADKSGESAGMEKADLKRLLRFAREEPISAAFAIGGDGKAVVQLDKRKQGRALERTIKEGAPDSKNHRWGTVSIDPDNPKTAVFQINKAGGGMARKLIIALKGTGYNKVRIVLDDGSEVESHEEEDDTAQDDEADGRQAAPSDDADQDTSRQAQENGQDTQDAQDGQEDQQAGQPDASALAQELTGLVRQMLDVIKRDPQQRAGLAELATDAQASLKRGDLDQAAAGIDILRQAIEAASGNGGQEDEERHGMGVDIPEQDAAANGEDTAEDSQLGASHPAAPAIAKARTAWMATRKKLEGDIGGLHGTFSSALKGHGMADELGKLFRTRVDSVLDQLDELLAHKLDEVNNAGDAAQRAKHVEDAHALIARYQAHVSSDQTIALLDRNPFAPLAIGKTVNATLSALSKAIR